MEPQRKWQKGCTSKEDLQEIVGKEQFYKTLGNTEKKLRVMERSPKTCVEACEFADEYEQARLQEPGQEKILTQDPRKKSTQEVPLRKCGFCGLIGHSTEECRKRLSASQQSGKEKERTMRCYHCGKVGHMSWSCPEKRALYSARGEDVRK